MPAPYSGSSFQYSTNEICRRPRCDASRTPECWEVKFGNANGTADEQETAKRCPANGSAPSQMINIVREPGTTLVEGTKVGMQCVTCVDLIAGMKPSEGCDY